VKIRRRVTDAWLRDVRSEWGERAYRAAADIVDVLAGCQAAKLQGVGADLARHGHRLEDVLAWFRLLASQSRAFRTALCDGGIVALASGWAEGMLRDEFGLAGGTPLELLRLRLQQQFELTTSMGEAPERVLALVVADTAGRHDCVTRVVHHARQAFTSGEAMATTPSGNLLVLVSRNPEVRMRTLQLIDALRHDDQLRGTPVRVWIEPLAHTAQHVDSHLLGLAS